MTTHADGARAGRLDPRVSDSPFMGLRYHVDAWAGDLDQLEDELRARLDEATAQRAEVLAALRENEDIRRHVLRALARYQPRDVVRCFHEGLTLSEELGRRDEQLAGLRHRVELVRAARGALRQIRAELREIAMSGGVRVNEQSALLTQATRALLALADQQHEETAQAILQGPMQLLADAAFEAEVAGRVLATDAAAAHDHAARCRSATAEAAQEVDVLVRELRPVTAERSLVTALRELLREPEAREIARLRVIGAERRLPVLQETTLYRIVEEAIDNALRHGHSSHIDIVLSFHEDRVVVVVKDDGEGFDVVATEARLGRMRAFGLIAMRERAALVGTKLEVRSLIGAGTEVRVMVGAHR